MITIELDETRCGKTITVISGIDADIYDLKKVKRALKKITGCLKSKLTDNNNIILLGSHIRKSNDFISQIGF